jgi:hypothetical protein
MHKLTLKSLLYYLLCDQINGYINEQLLIMLGANKQTIFLLLLLL